MAIAIECDVCGEAFAPRTKAVKRCGAACRKVANRAKAQEYRAAHRERLSAQFVAWREANRDSVLGRMAVWRDEHREHVNASSRAYREANRERVLTRTREWQRANRETARAASRAWKAAHPAAGLEHDARRRARKLGAAGEFSQTDWVEALSFFGNACAYCGSAGDLHREHVVPLCRVECAPTNGPENIVPACIQCNRSKHAKLVSEWRPEIVDELVARVTTWMPELAERIAHHT